MIFYVSWLWDGQMHTCLIEWHFWLKKSRKVPTLNTTFLLSHFFVQLGRLLHVPIDGVPQKKFFLALPMKGNFAWCGAIKWGWQNPSCILFRCLKVALLGGGGALVYFQHSNFCQAYSSSTEGCYVLFSKLEQHFTFLRKWMYISFEKILNVNLHQSHPVRQYFWRLP